MTQRNQHQPITAERLAAARQLFEDGASITEVVRTTRMARETLIKYLPDVAQPWSFTDCGSHGALIRYASQDGFRL